MAGRTSSRMRFTSTRVLRCLLAACVSPGLIGAPARAADPVIAAAGDIACDTTSEFFNGGLGTDGHCRQRATSDLLVDGGPLRGADARRHPVPRRRPGGLRGLLRPELGAGQADHPPDRRQPRVRHVERARLLRLLQRRRRQTGPAGDRDKGYYSYDLGSWHLVALNSNCDQLDRGAPRTDALPGSPQEHWLRTDLAAAPQARARSPTGTPRASTPGYRGNSPAAQAFWEALYEAGADLVLSGDAHDYERFAPQDPRGQLRPRPGHPPVRGRDRRRLLHRLEQR